MTKKPPNHLPDHQKIEVLSLWFSGELSPADIATEYNIHHVTIRTWLKKRPELVVEAQKIAEPAIRAREAAEEAARASVRAKFAAAAEEVRERARKIAELNEPIFRIMPALDREILQRRIDQKQSFRDLAKAYGVKPDYVRQLEIRWRRRGLLVPL